MINTHHKRTMFNTTEKQANWISNTSKKMGISISKFLCWLFARRLEEIVYIIERYNSVDEVRDLVEESKKNY